jgi:hypothetical protein
VVRGIDTHCGCFTQGGKGDPISVWTIGRDVSFLAVAALGFWLERPVATWNLFRKQ